MITNIVLTGIIIMLVFVLSDNVDETKLYKDKYHWYSQEYGKTQQELYEVKLQLVKVNKINEKLEQAKTKQAINISVDSDEVVSKVMAKVNEDIKAMKKQEQVFIKVDGREMDIKELTRAMRKAGSKLK